MFKVRFWRQRLYREVVRLQDSQISIARGMALGVIFGCLMPPGLQLVVAVPVALLLSGNPFAAVAGSFISNPITYIPLYALNCRVGAWCLGVSNPRAQVIDGLQAMVDKLKAFDLLSPVSSCVEVFDTIAPFLAYWVIGGLIIGLLAAVPTYYATYLAVVEVHKLRAIGVARRQARRAERVVRDATPEPRPADDPDEEAPDEQPPPPA